jgi:hypothetical protein
MKKTVWFWTNKLEICNGEIDTCIHLMDPFSDKKLVAKIRAYGYNGFYIKLPKERLYESKEDCMVGLRDYKINSVIE